MYNRFESSVKEKDHQTEYEFTVVNLGLRAV